MVFYFASDDHCPIHSAAILCMCDADPLRTGQQQTGAMSRSIDFFVTSPNCYCFVGITVLVTMNDVVKLI